MIAALVVVGILLGGLMLTSGASDPQEDEDAERPATERSSSTTTRRTPRSTARRSTTSTLPPPVAAEPIGARLAILRDGEVVLVDIDASQTSVREVGPLDIEPQGPSRTPAMVRGGHLVFQASGAAWSVPLLDPGPLHELGPSLLLVPARDEREVWLVGVDAGRATVQRWRPDGSGPQSEVVALPVDWTPIGEVEDGLVLRRGDGFRVWDPETGATVMASEPGARAIAAQGRTIVWSASCEPPLCALHLTDVRTGADRTVLLGETEVEPVLGSFSPDGRRLALRAYQTSASTWRPGVAVVDIEAGTVAFEERSNRDGASASFAWSPDSRWLFLLPENGVPANDVVAYAPERDEMVDLHLPSSAAGFLVVAY